MKARVGQDPVHMKVGEIWYILKGGDPVHVKGEGRRDPVYMKGGDPVHMKVGEVRYI